jgi:hypothetical protein
MKEQTYDTVSIDQGTVLEVLDKWKNKDINHGR